jgi:hypothetical protein
LYAASYSSCDPYDDYYGNCGGYGYGGYGYAPVTYGYGGYGAYAPAGYGYGGYTPGYRYGGYRGYRYGYGYRPYRGYGGYGYAGRIRRW